jgi:hypothetical protein
MLAVNFTPERIAQLKLLALLTKSKLKEVSDEEKAQTVGMLLGLTEEEINEIAAMKQETEETKAHDAVKDDASVPSVTQEAIILCGFDNQAVNLLLDGIRRGHLRNVPLKAMLTPNNISWTVNSILYELSKEHEYFHGNKK